MLKNMCYIYLIPIIEIFLEAEMWNNDQDGDLHD